MLWKGLYSTMPSSSTLFMIGDPPRTYSCPPWSPVKITPGTTCRYWARSASPPTVGSRSICLGVSLVMPTCTRVWASCFSAVTSNSFIWMAPCRTKRFSVTIWSLPTLTSFDRVSKPRAVTISV